MAQQQQNHHIKTNNSRSHTIRFLIFTAHVAEEVKSVVFTVVINPLVTRSARRMLQSIIRLGKTIFGLV